MTFVLFLSTWGIFAGVILVLVCGVFLLAQAKKDNSVMDIVYGPLFAVAGWVTWYLTGASTGVAPLLILGAVTLWALRLSIRIGKKNWGKPEDARYAAWRTEWSRKGEFYFVIRSFLQVNLLQGVVIAIVGLPMVAVLANPSSSSLTLIAGLLVFAFGLAYESLADYQLDKFIKGKQAGTETATLMKQGLFRYSRRPNYFGESMIWWGLAIAVSATPYGLIVFLSPITITYIVTKVTGPILENQFLARYPSEYTEYMKETNYFIPGKRKSP
jgi:steroid 5-alpha reductase family enzyme